MLQPSDFPRTFNAAFRVSHPNEGRLGMFVDAAFAVQLEKELNATTAELERTREQLRVARENLDEILKEMDFGNYMYAENVVRRALKHLAQSNPDKEAPNVPLE